MSDQLAHNLNTSMNMSTSSINCVEEVVNGSCLNIFDNYMDDGLASCSLEGNIKGVDNTDNSLHDIFQHLSQVPLHATTATPAAPPPTPAAAPLPTPPRPGHRRLEERHSRVLEQDCQNVGRKFKDIDVDIVKRHSKGKQPLETEQADNLHASSRRNSQRRNSEHKRRERINTKMRTIQALVPTCDKGDHASILDSAIKYIKQLKLQINSMSRSNEQSQLRSLCAEYAAQRMMYPTVVPGIGYGPWQSQMSPSGYPFMATPPGEGGIPQLQPPFSPIFRPPLQYLPTSITQPPKPTVLSSVPPLPQSTPPYSSDEPPHFQPPHS